jgi:hypothetical protein
MDQFEAAGMERGGAPTNAARMTFAAPEKRPHPGKMNSEQ